ncbi:hypothetical protein HOO65_020107 [Ceratocystis lukuohia]|uniref:DUF7223 domain-containing protein n=2 Tax=Ceratocystis TaxID=5157 RepID=A0A0F8DE98_CERFI|nr:hypothetical protein CFO_g3363 [Ceratocystis platani]
MFPQFFSQYTPKRQIIAITRIIISLVSILILLATGLIVLGQAAKRSYPPRHLEKSEVGMFLSDTSVNPLVAAGIQHESLDNKKFYPPATNQSTASPSRSNKPPLYRNSTSGSHIPAPNYPNATVQAVTDQQWDKLVETSKQTGNSELNEESWHAIPELSGMHDRTGESAYAIHDSDTLVYGPDPFSPQYLLLYKQTPLINLQVVVHKISTISFDGSNQLSIGFSNVESFSMANEKWTAAKDTPGLMLLTPSDSVGVGWGFFLVEDIQADWTAMSIKFTANPASLGDFHDYEYLMDSGSGFSDFDDPSVQHMNTKRDGQPWKTKLVSFSLTNENAVGFSSQNLDLGIKCSSCSLSGALAFSIRGGKYRGIDVKVRTQDVQATVLIEAYITGHLYKGATADVSIFDLPTQTINIPAIATIEFSIGNYIGYLIDDLAADGRVRFGARMTVPNSNKVIGHIEKNPFRDRIHASFDRPMLEVYRPMVAGSLDASGHVYHGIKLKFTVTPAYLSASLTAEMDWKIPRFNLEFHTEISTKCEICGPGKFSVKGRAYIDSVATATITPKIGDTTISWLVFGSKVATAVVDIFNFCIATGPSCKPDWKEVLRPKPHYSWSRLSRLKERVPNSWFREVPITRSPTRVLSMPPPAPDYVDDFGGLVWTESGLGRSPESGVFWGVDEYEEW